MRSSKGSIVFAYIVLILGGFIMIYPFLFQMFGALTTVSEYNNVLVLPIPGDLSPWRFESMFVFWMNERIWYSIGLTLVKVVWYTVTTTFTSVLGGYIFQKMQFWGKRFMFMFFMSSMMIPGVATLVPTYLMMAKFPLVGGNNIIGMGGHGFIDNIATLFVFGLVGIGNIFFIMQALKGIGDDYREAAEIDGASFLRVVFLVYFPMIRPIIAVNIINLFIGTWNDYSTTLFYLSGNEKAWTIGYTITEELNRLGIQGNERIPDYPSIFGMSFTYILPPIIVYVALQNQFVEGLTMGTIKS